jgi:hypothetical protein
MSSSRKQKMQANNAHEAVPVATLTGLDERDGVEPHTEAARLRVEYADALAERDEWRIRFLELQRQIEELRGS